MSKGTVGILNVGAGDTKLTFGKADYPDHWFVRIIGYGYEAIIAIPKSSIDKEIQSMPGMCPAMLHGSTIHLEGPS